MHTNNTYDLLLLSAKWKSKRKEILARDGFKCRNCGSVNALEVHHRQYHVKSGTQAKVEPWNYEKRLLITLCRNCHEAGHKTYKVPVFNIK